jgi:hypothetical protein
LIAKDYELPPLQTDGGSTLLPAFIKSVEESYEVYCHEDEANYRSNGEGTYMHKTNFNNTLKPFLGDIIRYCIKYWYLNPWLSCKDAYTKGIEHFTKHYKKKGDRKRLIDPILYERKGELLTQQVLALKVIPKEGCDEQRDIFADNEKAQHILNS